MAHFAPLRRKAKARSKASSNEQERVYAGAAVQVPLEAEHAEQLEPDLAVSEPGDALEVEADRVASAVMGAHHRSGGWEPAPLPSAGKGALFQTAGYGPLMKVQRSAAAEAPWRPAPSGKGWEPPPLASAGQGVKFGQMLSNGRAASSEPLSPSVRGFMEPRFQKDFSGVRIHRDSGADQLARAVDAKAFTVGQDVFFRRGQYEPGTEKGKHLLAHELAHVVQQGARSANSARPVIARQPANSAQVDAKPTGKESLAPGDLVRAKTRLQLGETASLEKVAGVIAPDTRLIVLEVDASGQRVKVGELSGDRILQPVGWTLRRFLGAKEGQRQLTATAPTAYSPGASPRAELGEAGSGPVAAQQDQHSAVVSDNYASVAHDPLYLDNFINDVSDAWFPNERVLALEYPNGVVLRIALKDLLRALDVPSELNPPPPKFDIEEHIRRLNLPPGDLVLPQSSSGSQFITIGQNRFLKDPSTDVIYPDSPHLRSVLPRLTQVVQGIESVRSDQELVQRNLGPIMSAMLNVEWSAPRGLGSLLVNVGRKLGGGKAAALAKALSSLDDELKATVKRAGDVLSDADLLKAVQRLQSDPAARNLVDWFGEDAVVALAKSDAVGAERQIIANLSLQQRAAQFVADRVAQGEKIVVNIGGVGAKHEAKGAINLNPNRIAARKDIPSHVQAPGELVGEVFPANSIDEAVAHGLPHDVIDWPRVARGLSRTMRPGGKVELNLRWPVPHEIQKMRAAFESAGFEIVESLAKDIVFKAKR